MAEKESNVNVMVSKYVITIKSYTKFSFIISTFHLPYKERLSLLPTVERKETYGTTIFLSLVINKTNTLHYSKEI